MQNKQLSINWQTVKRLHFIGIGGISMSGIAKVLLKRSYIITGSDSSPSPTTSQLQQLGIKIFIGHRSQNIIQDTNVIIRTSTVRPDNPEMIQAVKRNIPIIQRYQTLNFISKSYKINLGVAGSHGKTTTTSYLWKISNHQIFNLKPALFLGSTIHDTKIQGNCFQQQFVPQNKGNYCIHNELAVYQTDESDRSFCSMSNQLHHGIITNIDNDHLQFYNHSQQNLYQAFVQFCQNIINRKGIIVIGIDSLQSYRLYKQLKVKWSDQVISFSLKQQADFGAANIKDDGKCLCFDLRRKDQIILKSIRIPTIGQHNISNGVAALSLFLSIHPQKLEQLQSIESTIFQGLLGIAKRFMHVGEWQNILIVDDYAHHPTQIRATIKAVDQSKRWKKMLLIFQPHKYTRLISIYDDFINSFEHVQNMLVMDIFGISGGEIKKEVNKARLIQDILQKNKCLQIIAQNNDNTTLLQDVQTFLQKYFCQYNEQCLVLFVGAGHSSAFSKKLYKYLSDKKYC